MGLLDRARVPGAARLDARLRARRDLAARDGRSRSSARTASSARSRRCRSRSASAACGPRTCRPSSAARASARSSSASCTRSSASSPFAPVAFGNQAPDSGNSEILALAGTEDQKEQWLHPLLAGDLRSAFSMTEPDTRGLRPDAAADARGRGRRRLGHQRPQVVLHQRLGRRLPDRHGGHRPRRAPLPARVDVHRAGRHAGREDRARRADDGAPVRALRRLRRARRDPLRGRARAEGRAARRARRRLPDRPAAARPGPHPPLHALARRVAARVRHAVRARADALRARLAAGRQADGAELDRRLGGARCRRRG